MIRKDLPDFVYRDEFAKWKAVANECEQGIRARKIPVLRTGFGPLPGQSDWNRGDSKPLSRDPSPSSPDRSVSSYNPYKARVVEIYNHFCPQENDQIDQMLQAIRCTEQTKTLVMEHRIDCCLTNSPLRVVRYHYNHSSRRRYLLVVPTFHSIQFFKLLLARIYSVAFLHHFDQISR